MYLVTPGNLPEILRPDNVAEAEFAWTKEYGSALKIKDALGVCLSTVFTVESLSTFLRG